MVALSGGADSLALLGGALAEAEPLGLAVAAVVVDHGLQGGSGEVAAQAAETARRLGADPVRVCRVEVGSRGGPEAAAREARYEALGAAARELDAVAVLLGHTRDDQAESVLLGLGRGSGTRSLAGMADEVRRDGVLYLRPLLGLPRSTTVDACTELGLQPWRDPQNSDPAFTRVRVRRSVVPALVDALGPGSVESLARSADLLRDDADALDAWAEREFARATAPDEAHEGAQTSLYAKPGSPDGGGVAAGGVGVEVAGLVPLPGAVRRRVLRLACVDAGVPGGALTSGHLAALDRLVADRRGLGPVALPGGVEATRACGRLTFRGP